MFKLSRMERKIRKSKLNWASKILGAGRVAMRSELGQHKLLVSRERKRAQRTMEQELEAEEEPSRKTLQGLGESKLYNSGAMCELPIRSA